MEIIAKNIITGYSDPDNIPTIPPSLSTSSASDDAKICWISVFQNTGEIVNIEGVDYLKLVCYLSANFDILEGCKVYYDYKTSWAGTWTEAKTGPLEVMWDFTYGTNDSNLQRPTWTYGTTVIESQYTVRNYVYVPTGLTTCFIQARVDDEASEEFHKNWFVYEEKGTINAGKRIITGYSAPTSINLITANLNPTTFDVRTETKVEKDDAVTAATVQARLTNVAKRPYLTGTDDTEVYQMT